MTQYRFQVVIEQDEDGVYVADVPALSGCHTQGATFEEALVNIREVVELCVREMTEDGTPIDPRYRKAVGSALLDVVV